MEKFKSILAKVVVFIMTLLTFLVTFALFIYEPAALLSILISVLLSLLFVWSINELWN